MISPPSSVQPSDVCEWPECDCKDGPLCEKPRPQRHSEKPRESATGEPERAHNAIHNLGRAWPDRYEEMLKIAHNLDVALKSQIKITNTERAEKERLLALSATGRRVLFKDDAHCPHCGHSRDTSSVSSIVLLDGTHECQMCGALWAEINRADNTTKDLHPSLNNKEIS